MKSLSEDTFRFGSGLTESIVVSCLSCCLSGNARRKLGTEVAMLLPTPPLLLVRASVARLRVDKKLIDRSLEKARTTSHAFIIGAGDFVP